MHSKGNGFGDYSLRSRAVYLLVCDGCLHLFCALLLLVGVSGCSSLRRHATPPKAAIALTGGASIQQSGDAQVPAKLAVTSSARSLPLPAGSDIIFDEKLGTFTLHLSHESTLKTETREEKAEAPQAFTPPAPPTPADEAAGKLHVWYGIGLVVGIAAGLFGLVRGWNMVMYGGACVAGGCALALFVQQNPLVFVLIGVGLLLKIAGPVLWHTVAKKLPPDAPATL